MVGKDNWKIGAVPCTVFPSCAADEDDNFGHPSGIATGRFQPSVMLVPMRSTARRCSVAARSGPSSGVRPISMIIRGRDELAGTSGAGSPHPATGAPVVAAFVLFRIYTDTKINVVVKRKGYRLQGRMSV